MRTSTYFKGIFQTLAFLLATATALAAPPFSSTTVYPAVPPNITSSGSKPMVMLIASKDQSLFSPMFSDFEDLDGDGVIDETFLPSFKYYGYFDATKCYTYSTTNGRFAPVSTATISSNGRYVCGGTGQWSGNFLNWTTMTRLDTVRKMLYGGQRWIDSASLTVLQMARLSTDSHSFVKSYAGTDIRDYTPFTTANLTKTTGANANVYAGLTMCNTSTANDPGNNTTNLPIIRMVKGNYRLWATVEAAGTVPFVCKWGAGSSATPSDTVNSSERFGKKASRYFGGTLATQGQASLQHEQEFPSIAIDGAVYTGGPTLPELNVRVEVCNASLLGQERCKAYGTGSSQVYKPIGLMQDFGVSDSSSTAARTEFGMISGSYDKNLTAGALRKNMADLNDEINPSTGQFCFKALSEGSSSSNCPSGQISASSTPADTRSYTMAGAIRALDQVLLYGKDAAGYTGTGSFPQPNELTNGVAEAWGNPMGEMLIQALGYYAGGTSSNPSTTSKDTGVGIPVATWTDPLSDTNTRRNTLYGKSACRPLNNLVISSSALSFDKDEGDAMFAQLLAGSRGDLSAYTNAIGVAEGISGTLRSVGAVDGSFGDNCSGKSVVSLANVTGICPEAPSQGGSFKIAGAALYANTTKIRTIANPPTDLPNYALKVKTYAASLAGGSTTIRIPIPNSVKFVYLTPESLWDILASPNKKSTAGAIAFNTISRSPDGRRAAFAVAWNNTPFGGDYDMDALGYLMYEILNPVAPSTRYRIRITTDILNTGAGNSGTHGFSVIGTNFDSRYLTHLHNTRSPSTPSLTNPLALGHLCENNTYNSSTNLSVAALGLGLPPMTGNGFAACNGNKRTSGSPGTLTSGGNTVVDNDYPVQITFEMIGADSVTLQDPLWYAAKYGSFSPSNPSDPLEMPNSSSEWDNRRNDSKPCGGTTGLSCQDGVPDGYFLARRPELLEQQLRDTLESIINTTNSAPAVSSSQLSTGGYKYIATFEPTQNSGSVLAYVLNSNGSFSTNPSWDAGLKLTQVAPASRIVITNDGITGKSLRTSTSFSTDYQSALTGGTATDAITTAQATQLIDYTRGNTSDQKPAGIWRSRSVNNIMGTIVNSSPWLQSRPSAQSLGVLPSGAPTYSSFISAQSGRDRILWVGANDGMLHGFKSQGVNGGEPVLSFLPSPLVSRLRTMSQDSTQIISGMDGSPYTGDILTTVGGSLAWKTYLFSSLGRGARAVFALDVTSPANLTEANSGNVFKWMFSSDDDADLGYALGDAQLHPISNQASSIVRMNNNKYAILVPNGLGSGSGKAFLYVLFVDGPNSSGTWTSGTNYIKIPTDNLAGNGLTGANWADINNDGKADIIYGTDAKGRLWKFDVSSNDSSNWKSAFPSSGTPTPLFTATSGSNNLSISTAPVLTFPTAGGVMIGFGTGSAIASGDFPDVTKTQRFYSIYDRLTWGSRALPNSDLSTLVPRTLVRDSSGNVYVSSGNIAFDTATKDGWYVNFPALGSGSTLNNEMVLSSPQLRSDTIFFTTVRPKTSTTNQCYTDPEGTLYALDPLSGTPKLSLLGTMDLVVNGATIKVNKAGVSLQDQKVTIPVKSTGTKGNLKIVGQKSNVDLPEFLRLMRRQWREIPGMRTDQ